VQSNEGSVVQRAAIIAIAARCYSDSETLVWLKENVRQGNDWGIRLGATEAIIKHYREDSETFLILKQRSQRDEDWGVRRIAIDAISKYFSSEPGVFELLCDVIRNDSFTRNVSLSWEDNPRKFALQGLLTHYPNHPTTLELLNDKAVNDQDEQLREWAQQQLEPREKQKGVDSFG
jgi:HEAT repeat protein